jgi:tetratricopeptide (TPR) repeat protein
MTTESTIDSVGTTSLLSAAIQRAGEGAYDEAQEHLNALLVREPRDELALGMLAAVYAEMKQFDVAALHFQRVLDVNPVNALARFQLGLVLLASQKPDEALAAWQDGVYAENEYLVDYHRGVALAELGREREAFERFELARQQMPVDHVLYRQLLSHLIRLSQ